MIKIPKMPVT